MARYNFSNLSISYSDFYVLLDSLSLSILHNEAMLKSFLESNTEASVSLAQSHQKELDALIRLRHIFSEGGKFSGE